MRVVMKTFLFVLIMFIIGGCAKLNRVDNPLPKNQITVNNVKKTATISLFALNNYTDTPQAGLRASNLIYGVLLSKGYNVIQHTLPTSFKLEDAIKIAKADGADYLMYGGVSEWRYKTGIDGEPAVSIQCSLIDVHTSKIVWSATSSDNSWGNASVGTTAQELIDSMFKN